MESKEKTVYLIGTVHVSKNSAKKVEDTIATVLPDVVCLELDLQRFKAMQQVIREGGHFRYSPSFSEMMTLPGLLRWLQQEVGKEFGVMPGSEMFSGYGAARRYKINLALIDRKVNITIARMWGTMPFKEKVRLVSYMLATGGVFALKPILGKKINSVMSMFGSGEKLDMKKLENGKGVDDLMGVLKEQFPSLYRTLVEERNVYMCNNIQAILKKVNIMVVVVGMGHVSGMKKILKERKINIKTI